MVKGGQNEGNKAAVQPGNVGMPVHVNLKVSIPISEDCLIT